MSSRSDAITPGVRVRRKAGLQVGLPGWWTRIVVTSATERESFLGMRLQHAPGIPLFLDRTVSPVDSGRLRITVMNGG